jgi:hypothetical protein
MPTHADKIRNGCDVFASVKTGSATAYLSDRCEGGQRQDRLIAGTITNFGRDACYGWLRSRPSKSALTRRWNSKGTKVFIRADC